MGTAAPHCQNRFGDHRARKFVRRYRTILPLGAVLVSQCNNGRTEVLLTRIVGFQIPQVNRVLTIRSERNRPNEFIIVLRKLVYADKNLRLANLWTNLSFYLLNGARRLSAIDDLQAINLHLPVISLERIVAKLRTGDGNAIVVKIKIRTIPGFAKRGGDRLVHAIALQTQVTANIPLKQRIVVRIGKPCKLGDGYSPDQYAAKIECFDKRLAVEFQFCADRLLSLQQSQEFLRSDITPLDLFSKIIACIVDPSLRLLSPPYAIVYSDRSDARNRALLDEGTYVLNPLLQAAIQSHGRRRVEKRSDRANHTGDTVLGKR